MSEILSESLLYEKNGITVSEKSVLSHDNRSKLKVYYVRPSGDVRCVLQVCHGMCEYFGRYLTFAETLAGQGIAVVGHDLIGHGHTASDDDDLGYMKRGEGVDNLVTDLHNITNLIRDEFPATHVCLMGHSMGSFIVRVYLGYFPGAVDSAIIMGTAGPGAPTQLAKFLTCLMPERKRSDFLKKLAFGPYVKKLGKGCSPYAWLSVNEENVEKYTKDKFCMFNFTAGYYHTLFDLLGIANNSKTYKKYSHSLPLLFVAGEEDPVGSYGKGVRKVYENIKAAGVTDVSLILYPGDRHEILKENDADKVINDILSWINDHAR